MNVLDQWVQKIVAGVATAFGTMIVGYGIWQYQYYQAFGVPHPLRKALSDWWIGGFGINHISQNLDPKAFPDADVLQIFFCFFLTFAFVLGVFIQSAAIERIKPLPLYLMCFIVGAVPWPILTYLVWGSLSPLTNRGLHDYTGVFNLYLFVGAISVTLATQLGPRLGTFDPHPSGSAPAPHRLPHVAIGVLLLMFAIPFIVLGSGYIIPDSGYFGISMTTTGVGVVFINVLLSFIGGGLSGAILSYRQKVPMWALLGPIAGYVSCSALFDVGRPLSVFLVSLGGPPVVYGAYLLLRRLRIDDPKIGPLTLGGGLYGALIVGIVSWGTKTGGYLGLTGKYGFQNASINLGWQALGSVITIAFGVVSCWVLCAIFKRTIGLRVNQTHEIEGLDEAYWPTPALGGGSSIGASGGAFNAQAGVSNLTDGTPARSRTDSEPAS